MPKIAIDKMTRSVFKMARESLRWCWEIGQMDSPAETSIIRPSHVRDDLVTDIDVLHPNALGEDPMLSWSKHLDPRPLIWTPHNGGHWIVTDGAIFDLIYKDPETFSSSNILVGPRGSRPQLLPSEYDAPLHTNFRKHIMEFFHPRSVKAWTEEARTFAVDLIETMRPTGHCEFMADFAKQLPMVITLRMLGLPLDDRGKLVEWVFTAIRATDPAAAEQSQIAVGMYLVEKVSEKIANPAEDGLSLLLTKPLPDGSELTFEQKVAMSTNLLFGGLDTVTTTMGFTALYLAENPSLQDKLRGNNNLIARTIEELLRRFPITQVGRIVTKDIEFHGALLKAGDQVIMPTALHSLDPRYYPDPEKLMPGRPNAHTHHTMGGGAHRCAGALLAHAELRVFLEEWLTRMPIFSLDPENPPVKLPGLVPCVDKLPLIW